MWFIVSLCSDSQGDRLRMCVTLLGCFSILSFEINKIKGLINSIETRMGLELFLFVEMLFIDCNWCDLHGD